MSLTPEPIDLMSRWMAATFDERQIITVPTGFQSFFGNPDSGAATHYIPDQGAVDIDIIRGTKKTAALIPRGTVSRSLGPTKKNLHSGKHTSFTRKWPLSEESGNIGANEILYRQAGEDSYSARTRIDRMRQKAGDIHLESIRRMVRLFEVLAASSVLTGTMPAILGTNDPELLYDFRRRASHTIPVSTAWDAAGDVFKDLDAACELIEQDGNAVPDMLCIGGEALKAMTGNTVFQALADNRNLEFIQVSDKLPVPPEFSRFVKSGWSAQGRLRTLKGYTLWVFTYNRTYEADDGKATKLMPEDKAFVTSSRVRCDRYFGPPEVLPMTTHRRQEYQDLFGFDPLVPLMPGNVLGGGAVIDGSMFHCDCYMAGDAKSLTIRTQSAPIYATTQTDGFVVLTGLTL